MECLFLFYTVVIHPSDQDKHIDVAHWNICRAFETVLRNVLPSMEEIKHGLVSLLAVAEGKSSMN